MFSRKRLLRRQSARDAETAWLYKKRFFAKCLVAALALSHLNVPELFTITSALAAAPSITCDKPTSTDQLLNCRLTAHRPAADTGVVSGDIGATSPFPLTAASQAALTTHPYFCGTVGGNGISCWFNGNQILHNVPTLFPGTTVTFPFTIHARAACETEHVVKSSLLNNYGAHGTVLVHANHVIKMPDCPKQPQCSDGIDNDGDGLVDLNDPGCDNPEDDDERDSLGIKKTVQATTVAGNEVTYTITVHNPKNTVALNVNSFDFNVDSAGNRIPFQLPFLRAAGDLAGQCVLWHQDSNVIRCPLGNIEPGGTRTFTMTFLTTKNKQCDQTIMNQVDAWETDGHGNLISGIAWDKAMTRISCKTQCEDGVDNDGDNKVDWPSDPGCAGPTDDSESPDLPSKGISVDVDVSPDPVVSGNIVEKKVTVRNTSQATLSNFIGGDAFHTATNQRTNLPAGFSYLGSILRINNVEQNAGCSLLPDADGFDVVWCGQLNSNPTPGPFQNITLHPGQSFEVIHRFQTTQNQSCSDSPGLLLRNTMDVGTANGSAVNWGTMNFRVLCKEPPQCSDGKDNDGDEKVDFPADPGCDSPHDDDETDPRKPECRDGIDNDKDGATDFPHDFSCSSPDDDDETFPKAQCQDHKDNDGDGLIDLNDPGCDNLQDNDEFNPPTAECSDGQDNDGDGKIDFPNDPGCVSPQDDDETDSGKRDCSVQDDRIQCFRNLLGLGAPDKILQSSGGDPQFGGGHPLFYWDSVTDINAYFNALHTCGLQSLTPGSFSDGVVQGLPTTTQERRLHLNAQCTRAAVDSYSARGHIITNDVAEVFQHPFTCSQQRLLYLLNESTGNVHPKNGVGDGGDFNSTPAICIPEGLAACSDRIDNDQDGLTDFPADPGCSSPEDDDEFNPPVPQCDDGLDNDKDGLVDLNDPGCDNPQDDDEFNPPDACVIVRASTYRAGPAYATLPANLPGNVIVRDLDLFNNPLQASDLNNASLFIYGDSNLASGPFRSLTQGEKNLLSNFYHGGGNFTFAADNPTGDEASAGTRDILNSLPANMTYSPIFHGLQAGFHTPNVAQYPFLNGKVFNFTNTGLNSPGDIVNISSPAECVFSLNNRCHAAWKPAQGNQGFVFAEGNAGVGSNQYLANFIRMACEGPTTQCSDGVDNDGDGLVDLNDPGCSSPEDDDEFNPPPPECSDGKDNDGDGKVDFPRDPDCDSPTDDDESPDICRAARIAYIDLQPNPPFVPSEAQALQNQGYHVAFFNRTTLPQITSNVLNTNQYDIAYFHNGCGGTTGLLSTAELNVIRNFYLGGGHLSLTADDNHGDSGSGPQRIGDCQSRVNQIAQNLGLVYSGLLDNSSAVCQSVTTNHPIFAGEAVIGRNSDAIITLTGNVAWGNTQPTVIATLNSTGQPAVAYTRAENGHGSVVFNTNETGLLSCGSRKTENYVQHLGLEKDCPGVFQCNDGIDNDGDGKVDFPQDPGCSSPQDDDEFNPPARQCNDGVDNDGDGKVDFPNDPGCISPEDDDETDKFSCSVRTVNAVWQPTDHACYYNAGTNSVLQGNVDSEEPPQASDCGNFTVLDLGGASKTLTQQAVHASGDHACLYQCPEGYALADNIHAEAPPQSSDCPQYTCRFIGNGGQVKTLQSQWQPGDHSCNYSCPAGFGLRTFVAEGPTGSQDCNSYLCQEATICPAPPPAECSDGIDNDGDGKVDFPNDPGCDSPQDDDEFNQPITECNDGADNDGDGLADFPHDPGCDSPQDNSERDPNGPECDNGRDDDGDGKVDFPSDPECDSPFDDSERDPECSDGKDNDGDGAVDWPHDFSCSSPNDDDETFPKAQCQDGIDNDGDGLIDLNDPGCDSLQDNDEKNPNGPECDNGKDDDGDGKVDFPLDPECDSPFDDSERDPECSDGKDNDGDGAADFPHDFSCSSPNDDDETFPKAQCQDGVDNDSDGLADFPSDPGCDSPQDNSERNPNGPECDNGRDDDGDGHVDFPRDPQCTGPTDDTETSQCSDNVDNDGDGAVDWPHDFSCSSPNDDDETFPKAQCQDGIDNDGDGLIDLNDPGCDSLQDNDEKNPNGPECDNGKDDDGDGKIDFPADPNCDSPTDDSEDPPECSDRLDNDGDGAADWPFDFSCDSPEDDDETFPKAQCQDGADNDGDGAIDWPADFGCSSPNDNDESNPLAQCQDKADNDNDGLIDFPADPGCLSSQDNDEFDADKDVADLMIIKEDLNGPNALRGGTITYRIKVKNLGPVSATNVIAEDPVPAGLTFRADLSDQDCVLQGGDILCNNLSLAPGQIREYVVGFSVDANAACGSPIDNTATVTALQNDPNLANNSSSVTGQVLCRQCQDGIDNDGDGVTDFPADPGCSAPEDDDESDGTTQCQDGADNDGDGAVDFPNDPGCDSPQDNDEKNPNGPQCDNGKDDDGDGLSDFPADPGCDSPNDNSEDDEADLSVTKSGPTSVHRGQTVVYDIWVENHGAITATNVTVEDPIPAGLIFDSNASSNDCVIEGTDILCNNLTLAPGARQHYKVAFRVPDTANVCDTTIVNEATVTALQNDPNLSNNKATASTSVICAQCQDGEDNDGDGLIDFGPVVCVDPAPGADPNDPRFGCFPSGDPGCNSPLDDSEKDPNGPQCDNGIDDDGDGKIDFPADPDCDDPGDDSEESPECSDGIDNDGDGAADFPHDFSCSSPEDDDETFPKAQCQDGLDNDGDGFIDFGSDPGCDSPQDNDEKNPNGPQCDNGIDDDGDGKIDFPADPGCIDPGDNSEADEADLSVTKTGPASVNRGGTVVYQITARNNGPLAATNVTVEDPIPAGLTFNASQSSNDCVVEGGDVLCNNTNLIPGGQKQYLVAFDVPDTLAVCNATIVNEATVTAFENDPNLSNNKASATTSVFCAQCQDGVDNDNDSRTDFPADLGCTGPTDDNESDPGVENVDLVLELTATPNPEVEPGGTIVFHAAVTNNGPATDNNIQVVNTPTPGMVFVPGQSDPSCSLQGNGTVICSPLSLGPGQSTSIDIAFSAPANAACGSIVSNTVDVVSSLNETNPSDNTRSLDVDIICAACQNGVDDDGDGATDFPADPGCSSPQDDDEKNPNGPECDNGQDDDGDGKIDFPADPDCDSPTDDSEKTPECRDGVDNDGDGATDWPSDFSCSSPEDDDETIPKAQCQDGIDNDGDGATDWPSDFSCSSAQDDDEGDPLAQCQDGVDNDGDGVIDFDSDPGCSSPQDNDESDGTTECQDGVDNDGDGVIDFGSDPGCSSPQDDDESDGTTQCQDGTDNDGDGLSDFPADPGCSSPQDDDEKNPNGPECDNGQDDDGDGQIDFPADPGCSDPADDTEKDDADLRITKSGPTHVGRGQTVKYELWVRNGGPLTATSVTVEDPIPAGLTFNSSQSSAECVMEAGDILCNNTTLAPGGEAHFTIAFDVPDTLAVCDSTIVNEATVTAFENDPDLSNNKASATTTVTCNECQDGVDNDGDGAIDHPADFSCNSPEDDDESVPSAQCQDGVDNDGDGVIDFGPDPGCESPQDNDESDGTTECQDGVDNDGDGVIDFGSDPGCSSPQDDDESDGTTQCQDGTDNDGDGATDFPADPGCSSPQDDDEKNPNGPECDNGQDDDGDGKIDFPADPDCDSPTDDSEKTPECRDGVDNDGDGATDWPSDFSCSSPEDDDETIPKAQCQDGIDNDGDGATDWPSDFSCSSAQDDDEGDPLAQCQDGVDNDGDGVIDFDSDPGCSSPQDNDESDGTTECQDGVDNDGDGVIDFGSDPGCSSPQDDDESDGTTQCQDGTDNDGDGLSDFPADPGCSSPQDDDEKNPNGPECDNGQDDDGDGQIDFPADPGCSDPADDTEKDDADLRITKSGPTHVGRGQTVKYELWVRNGGPLTATSVTVEDPIPAGLTFNSSQSSAECVMEAGDILCNNTTLAPGGEAHFTIAFDVPDTLAVCDSTIVNEATVTAFENDPDLSNNKASATTTVTCNECQDGVDNDGDGAIDHPADFSCNSPEDDDESVPSAQCQDGVDNDGDGVIDFGPDPGCESPQDNDEHDPNGPQCDNGQDDDGDGKVDFPADPGCTGPTDDEEREICGDGVLQPGEQCDDGNTDNNDGCSASCQIEACGDGIKQDNEQCDDGNTDDNDGCSAACVLEACGDGIKQDSEQCDDGNTDNNDGCSSACLIEACGDGVKQDNEQCDDGNTDDNDGCSAACLLEACGDGIKQDSEQCDDGNTDDNDGCSSACLIEACGDGIKQDNEQCDDGNTDDNDDCSAACLNEFCGDGVKQDSEQCDDGNTDDNDGCSAACLNEFCGDGIKQDNEQCDDGNTDDDDGCSALCKIEVPECSDGVDNDGDGKIDLDDFGCDDPQDDDESGGTPTCKGKLATIYVAHDGIVVGGPKHGKEYYGKLRGTAGNDVIVGSNGDDYIDGESGDDIICGRGGDDRIEGGSGNDYIEGGDGHDEIDADAGDDIVFAGPGDDEVDAASGNDIVCAGAGDDEVEGRSGDDEIDGGTGTDTIEGDTGHDLLDGGDGDDTVSGGIGDDICDFGDRNNRCELVTNVTIAACANGGHVHGLHNWDSHKQAHASEHHDEDETDEDIVSTESVVETAVTVEETSTDEAEDTQTENWDSHEEKTEAEEPDSHSAGENENWPNEDDETEAEVVTETTVAAEAETEVTTTVETLADDTPSVANDQTVASAEQTEEVTEEAEAEEEPQEETADATETADDTETEAGTSEAEDEADPAVEEVHEEAATEETTEEVAEETPAEEVTEEESVDEAPAAESSEEEAAEEVVEEIVEEVTEDVAEEPAEEVADEPAEEAAEPVEEEEPAETEEQADTAEEQTEEVAEEEEAAEEVLEENEEEDVTTEPEPDVTIQAPEEESPSVDEEESEGSLAEDPLVPFAYECSDGLLALDTSTKSKPVLTAVNHEFGASVSLKTIKRTVTSVALDADGTLYGLEALSPSDSQLVVLERDGSVEALGATGLPAENIKLAFGPEGALYALDQVSGTVYEVNSDTGAVSAVAKLPSLEIRNGDYVIDADSQLLYVSESGEVYQVDLTQIAADPVLLGSLPQDGQTYVGVGIYDGVTYVLEATHDEFYAVTIDGDAISYELVSRDGGPFGPGDATSCYVEEEEEEEVQVEEEETAEEESADEDTEEAATETTASSNNSAPATTATAGGGGSSAPPPAAVSTEEETAEEETVEEAAEESPASSDSSDASDSSEEDEVSATWALFQATKNDVFLACAKGQVILDSSGKPYNCSRYHDNGVWRLPEDQRKVLTSEQIQALSK